MSRVAAISPDETPNTNQSIFKNSPFLACFNKNCKSKKKKDKNQFSVYICFLLPVPFIISPGDHDMFYLEFSICSETLVCKLVNAICATCLLLKKNATFVYNWWLKC